MIVASMRKSELGRYVITVTDRCEETGEEIRLFRSSHTDMWAAYEEVEHEYHKDPEIFDEYHPEEWYVLTGEGEYLQPDCLTLLECLETTMEIEIPES